LVSNEVINGVSGYVEKFTLASNDFAQKAILAADILRDGNYYVQLYAFKYKNIVLFTFYAFIAVVCIVFTIGAGLHNILAMQLNTAITFLIVLVLIAVSNILLIMTVSFL
jgi:hypothetical protein